MINRELIVDDIEIAKALAAYLTTTVNALISLGRSPQEFMSMGDYMGLIALLHVVNARADGAGFDDALNIAEKTLSTNIAAAESAEIDEDPNQRKM